MDEQVIFAAALEQDADRRAAFLDEACGADPDLRQRIDKLLKLHDQAGVFFEKPAAEILATAQMPAAAERPGTVIGHYKLLEQIGEGGMGTVWMAQQTEPVKRVVAVKLIKAGMDSKQVIARFEAERQALALMDHPNIAKVLDADTAENGRPYFVMDLVKGVPITKYCDEHHLTLRQRLELFVPVCHAIQHAHQKGIIHRDLKPSNVLVALYDGNPVPKVIDFGVAKAAGQPLTEQTLVTGFGAIVGTLEYMSPELAEINQLDVDTRSDIYSLGVLLYELLAGSPPFSRKELEKAGMLEMLRVIREQEPSKPSTKLSTAEGLPTLAANRGTEPAKLTKLVRGELDWIVMKALEKDRNRRYETANGFALDVQHYLADEAVLACPPSTWYRLRKFALRNKVGLVAAVVVALAVLLGIGSLGWAVRDRQVRDMARERAVETALDDATQLQGRTKWTEALEAVKRAEGILAGTSSCGELCQSVAEQRRDVEMVLRIQEIRLQLAAVGEDRDSLDYGGADREYARAFKEYGIDVDAPQVQDVGTRIRARSIWQELVAALDDWAFSRLLGANENDWKHLLAVARAADPDARRNQLRDALERRDRKALTELATVKRSSGLPPQLVVRLAVALRGLGAVDQAIALLRQAQQLHPDDFWINFDLASCLYLANPRKLDDAIVFSRIALALRPSSPVVHSNLGHYLTDKQQLDEAIAACREAIRLRPDYAVAHSNLANALIGKGQLDLAIDACKEAVRFKPDYAMAYNNLGAALARKGQIDEAIDPYQEAVRLRPDMAMARINLGISLRDKRLLDQAISVFRAGIALAGRKVAMTGDATSRRDLAKFHNELGLVLRRAGRHGEAAQSHRQALVLYEKLAADFPDVTDYREWVPKLRHNVGNASAEFAWQLATSTNPMIRNSKRAAKLAKEALEITSRFGTAWNALGAACYRDGDWKAAIAALEKAAIVNQTDDRFARSDPETCCAAQFVLAMAAWQMGDKEKAGKTYQMAVQWMEKNQRNNEELRRFRQEAEGLMNIESRVDNQEAQKRN